MSLLCQFICVCFKSDNKSHIWQYFPLMMDRCDLYYISKFANCFRMCKVLLSFTSNCFARLCSFLMAVEIRQKSDLELSISSFSGEISGFLEDFKCFPALNQVKHIQRIIFLVLFSNFCY